MGEKGKMKKAIFAFVLVSAIFLCACNNTIDSGEYEKYSKYDNLIDSLENGNYEEAISEVSRIAEENGYNLEKNEIPTSEVLIEEPEELEEPQIIEVEINNENFFDYYDVVYNEDEFVLDAEGNISEIQPRKDTFYYKLKDKYSIVDENSMVSIGYTVKYQAFDLVSADFATGEYLFSDTPNTSREMNKYGGVPESDSKTVKGKDVIYPSLYFGLGIFSTEAGSTTQGSISISKDKYDNYLFLTMVRPVDYELVRAEGILYLSSK